MNHLIRFAKASGAGNDFVVINNYDGSMGVDYPRFARAVCTPHIGIGADGLLVVERSSAADFRMLYYNSDGSTGGMCGNGGRCISRFAVMSGICGASHTFEAFGHPYRAEVGSEIVRLWMRNPEGMRPGQSAEIGGRDYACHWIDTGAPHLVLFVDDLERVDVTGLGQALRHHQVAGPGGSNVNFVQVADRSTIRVRTYERGVEAETLACGTGSVGCAVVSALSGAADLPLRVIVRSGKELRVAGRVRSDGVSDITLEGPADILFQGTILYDDQAGTLNHLPSL